MSIKLYPPLNILKKVNENIWLVDGDIIHMSFSIIQVPFSTRMTVVKLSNGDILLHSPIAYNQGLASEILAHGPIKHLVSPNAIHYAYITEWKKHFPDAIAWASPGVEKRAQSQQIETKFDQSLTGHSPEEWAGDINQLIFQGSSVIKEVVFFHKSSRTLILADLIENFETDNTNSHFWKLVHKLGRIAAPNGQTPIDYRLTFLGNEKAAKQSFQKILSWQPESIIIAHGEWIPSDGVKELKRRMKWLTN